jgi:hypothetical protein
MMAGLRPKHTQKYENKKSIFWLKKLKIDVKLHGEHNV